MLPSKAHMSVVPNRVPSVLVVEDDPDLLRMVSRILSDFAKVTTAIDGEDAMLKVKGGLKPDLVVTDVMMPKLDGLELARLLKAEASTAKVPVIMLTAKGAPMDVIRGINAGARSYLTKPFKHADLIDKVKKALHIIPQNS